MAAREAAPKSNRRGIPEIPEVVAREVAPRITVKNPEIPEVVAREVAPKITVRNPEILRELIRERQWPV